MVHVADVADYARRLHRGTWYVHRLPRDLGARRFERQVEPDILGIACQGERRAIGLSAAIVGTPLELPVIAHECGHLLLGHDIGFCSTTFSAHVREERDAWDSAALLAVSREAGVAIAEHQTNAVEVAEVFGVPRPLAYMRGALAVLLGEADGDRERAEASLSAARSSLEHWMAWLAGSLPQRP